MDLEEQQRLEREITYKISCIIRQEKLLENIYNILQPLAGNRKFMQLAGPARQVCRLIKEHQQLVARE